VALVPHHATGTAVEPLPGCGRLGSFRDGLRSTHNAARQCPARFGAGALHLMGTRWMAMVAAALPAARGLFLLFSGRDYAGPPHPQCPSRSGRCLHRLALAFPVPYLAAT